MPAPPELTYKMGTWVVGILMAPPSGAIRFVKWGQLDINGNVIEGPGTAARRILPGEVICQSGVCLVAGSWPRFQRPARLTDNWQYLLSLLAYIRELLVLWASPQLDKFSEM